MTPNDKTLAELHKPESNEWPALVGRIVSDLTRIIHTEFRLFQASLSPLFSTAIDRLLANLLALVTFIVGGICLLIAFVIFLHRWIDWDAAFLVTAGVSLIAGYVCSRVGTIRSQRAIANLERIFSREPEEASR